MKTIVFDFDKTLTYRDSLTQLFVEQMLGWRFVFFPYYILLKVMSKIKVISVRQEKELAMRILFPKPIDETKGLLRDFSNRIKLSPINEILKRAVSEGDQVIVLSASPESYLQQIYPQCLVIGMKIDNRMHIIQHPYGEEKLRCLNRLGINFVNELYYDSKSDEAIFPICSKAFKVKNGQIQRVIEP